MAKRNLRDKLISRKDIKEPLKLIDISLTDYISPNGNIYVDYGNNMFYKKKTFINKNNGYVYVNINRYDGKSVSRRVHKLVALAYIPNPDNLPIVMHKDNDKSNVKVSNLKWGTISENVKQAFEDKLIINAKGFDDSQSIAICVFNMNMELVDICGSAGEVYRKYNVTKSTILNQCKHQVKTKPRCNYYFRYYEEYLKYNKFIP